MSLIVGEGLSRNENLPRLREGGSTDAHTPIGNVKEMIGKTTGGVTADRIDRSTSFLAALRSQK